MPSFTLGIVTTSPQSLGTGDDGYIGRTGGIAIAGSTATALSMSGEARLVSEGSIYARTTGIVMTPLSGVTLLSTATVSGGQNAIEVDASLGSGSYFVVNSGEIWGEGGGIVQTGTDASRSVTPRVVNSGSIAVTREAFTGVGISVAHSGSGLADIVNSGRIEAFTAIRVNLLGTVPVAFAIRNSGRLEARGDAIQIFGSGRAFIDNTGTILARDSAIYLGNGADFVRNTGTILGDIWLGDASDDFDGRGGKVFGIVRGGFGSDLYIIDDPGIRIVEIAGDGSDTVQSAAGDFQLPEEVEVLELIGAAVGGAGNALANSIAGNALDNRLAGLGGNDTIAGGAGNDRIEGGEGNDVLFGEEGADEILGGEGSDSLVGGTGEDDLRGGDGFDTLRGGTGDDRLAGGLLGDQLFGEGGDDTLSGGSGFDTLEGGNNDDALFGGGGNDRLVGGNGADTLTGGAGADAFVFLAPSESAPATPDTIADFERGTDLIDLAGIDANTAVAGDQAFAFIGTAAFSAPGQLRLAVQADGVIVQGNTTGTTGAEFEVFVQGLATMTAADFVL